MAAYRLSSILWPNATAVRSHRSWRAKRPTVVSSTTAEETAPTRHEAKRTASQLGALATTWKVARGAKRTPMIRAGNDLEWGRRGTGNSAPGAMDMDVFDKSSRR